MKPSDLPPAKPGLFAFNEEQISQAGHRQRVISRRNMCAHLRLALSKHLAGVTDEELVKILNANERSGATLGLDSEKAIVQWTQLAIVSKNRATEDRDF